jgi:hypothetical protein
MSMNYSFLRKTRRASHEDNQGMLHSHRGHSKRTVCSHGVPAVPASKKPGRDTSCASARCAAVMYCRWKVGQTLVYAGVCTARRNAMCCERLKRPARCLAQILYPQCSNWQTQKVHCSYGLPGARRRAARLPLPDLRHERVAVSGLWPRALLLHERHVEADHLRRKVPTHVQVGRRHGHERCGRRNDRGAHGRHGQLRDRRRDLLRSWRRVDGQCALRRRDVACELDLAHRGAVVEVARLAIERAACTQTLLHGRCSQLMGICADTETAAKSMRGCKAIGIVQEMSLNVKQMVPAHQK